MKRFFAAIVLLAATAAAAWSFTPVRDLAAKVLPPEAMSAISALSEGSFTPVRELAAKVLPDRAISSVTALSEGKSPFDSQSGAQKANQPAASSAAPAAGKSARPAQPPAPVTAVAVTLADMPVTLTAPGTVEPRATVTVRPRVDGQIAQMFFKEGDLVKEGQVLFRLDDRLIKAQIAQAEANIKKDEANLVEAQANFGRRSVLVQKKIVSEAAMDTARATTDSLKASIAAGRAALEAQKTQLDYLVVPAPITGRTGSTTFKPGANIRSADTTPLVVINQTQPVVVTFALPQTDILALRGALDRKAKAVVKVPGPRPETREAVLDFIDNQVDKSTGTLTAKVLAPNLDELLWPGLAVEVALTVDTKRDTLSVPVSAVLPSQLGMIVWVIGADQKVQPRPVTLIRVVDQTAFLSDGVKSGEVVVTDGHGRIAPGFTVKVQMPVEPQAVPAGNSPAAAANPGPAKPGAPGPAPGARPAQAGEQRPGGGRKS